MEKLRTFVILAIFIILSAGCIYNMIRHHKEEKAAKEAEKLAKKRSRTLVNKEAIEEIAETPVDEERE